MSLIITSPASSPIPIYSDKFLDDLPRAHFWDATDLRRYHDFWFPAPFMKSIVTFRSTFHARDDDIILASSMKTGTTWLKALALAITQTNENNEEDILTTANPHSGVPTVEAAVYADNKAGPRVDIYDTSSPRLIHTHLPYSLLPDSVRSSRCRVVYVARNLKDTLVSTWHFFNKILKPYPLEKAFECFVNGAHQYGPFFDHVAEYWRESEVGKMLFVKYEELSADPRGQVSRIADFVGRPFANESEVDEVLRRCSFERLKGLEVNKSESFFGHIPNETFFRKGGVGDWKNYLSTEMGEEIDRMSRVKLEPLGLFL